LQQHGVTLDRIYEALASIRGTQRVTDQNPEGKYQALEKYGRDLTQLARRGKLDPVIGRDEEIRRVIQVLSRRPVHVCVGTRDGPCVRPMTRG
jgi:ATP-dependent Clp protease ATP-binding subunit ClpB